MEIINSFRHAFRGLAGIIRRERNARVHLASAILAMTAGLLLGVSDAELAAIFFAVVVVFLAEIFNTAIERTLDLVDPAPNDRIGRIKDMAAGGVLVAAVGAAIIGGFIFWPYVLELIW